MIRPLLSALLALLLAAPVFAAQTGKDWPLKEKDNRFAAGEPEISFEFFKARKVEEMDMHWQYNWSVTACVQMILGNQDLYEIQRDILRRIYKKRADEKKSMSAVRARLNNWKPEKGVRVKASKHKIKKLKIADDLAKYGPLMVGVEDPNIRRMGLPLILLQVHYEYDYFKKKIPVKVVLLDPWPDDRKTRTEMTWYDFINHLEWATRLEVRGR
jgi:hypothetical protein